MWNTGFMLEIVNSVFQVLLSELIIDCHFQPKHHFFLHFSVEVPGISVVRQVCEMYVKCIAFK